MSSFGKVVPMVQCNIFVSISAKHRSLSSIVGIEDNSEYILHLRLSLMRRPKSTLVVERYFLQVTRIRGTISYRSAPLFDSVDARNLGISLPLTVIGCVSLGSFAKKAVLFQFSPRRSFHFGTRDSTSTLL